jgi:group II intron reverse transcriptase/maturase
MATSTEREERRDEAKPFAISKKEVWQAYKHIAENGGAAGVDEQSLEDFESDLKNNLYKLWNRMASGSYFPPPVREVEIPKATGDVRKLGIPTIADRIAQTVVKQRLEPGIDPQFHRDSYGYRPGRSAHQALEQARERCWSQGWVIDLDIKSFFDTLDHELMMRAIKRYTKERWILLYVERWLKASVKKVDGTIVQREMGTPQGGVISPLLANVFMHLAFDTWMQENHPDSPFERYADDIVVHCKTRLQAERVREAIDQRLQRCRLKLHPEKTKIVCCIVMKRSKPPKDVATQFDFLGYTFRRRTVRTRAGKLLDGFTPAVSPAACTRMAHEMRRGWQLLRKTQLEIEQIAKGINPTLRGWFKYYGRFCTSAMQKVVECAQATLIRWARRKYKTLRSAREADIWLHRIAKRKPRLFAHWHYQELCKR